MAHIPTLPLSGKPHFIPGVIAARHAGVTSERESESGEWHGEFCRSQL